MKKEMIEETEGKGQRPFFLVGRPLSRTHHLPFSIHHKAKNLHCGGPCTPCKRSPRFEDSLVGFVKTFLSLSIVVA